MKLPEKDGQDEEKLPEEDGQEEIKLPEKDEQDEEKLPEKNGQGEIKLPENDKQDEVKLPQNKEEQTSKLPEQEKEITSQEILVVSEKIFLKEDKHIKGTVSLDKGAIELKNHTLEIDGDLILKGGQVDIETGKLIVHGNCILTDEGITNHLSYIGMRRPEGQLIIDKNLEINSKRKDLGMEAGRMQLGGNFIYQEQGELLDVHNVRLYLQGDQKQLISGIKYFNHLIVQGNQRRVVKLQNSRGEEIQITRLIIEAPTVLDSSNLHTVIRNLSLQDNLEFIGYLNISMMNRNNQMNIDSHILKVIGTLEVYCGIVILSDGILEIEGDYKIGTYGELIVKRPGALHRLGNNLKTENKQEQMESKQGLKPVPMNITTAQILQIQSVDKEK